MKLNIDVLINFLELLETYVSSIENSINLIENQEFDDLIISFQQESKIFNDVEKNLEMIISNKKEFDLLLQRERKFKKKWNEKYSLLKNKIEKLTEKRIFLLKNVQKDIKNKLVKLGLNRSYLKKYKVLNPRNSQFIDKKL